MKVLRNTKKATSNVNEVKEISREDYVKEGISKIEAILNEYQIAFDAEITLNSKGHFGRVIVIDKASEEENKN